VVGRGDQRLAGRYACYRVYACNGGGFYSVAALEPKFWATLCNAVGRPDLIDQQFAEGKEGEAVHRAFEELFASRNRAEWEKELAECDACCEPVLELDEVMSHPQIAARQKVRKVDGDAPRLGEHTAVVLAEVGVDSSRYEELERQGVI
jgi:crotonobetainyl-CoA:carnitine CoA-transferase CaiB-like acyl-CoA transferase